MSENSSRRLIDNLIPVLNRMVDLGHNLIRWRTIFADRVIMRTGTVEDSPTAGTDIPNKSYVDSAVGGGMTVKAADGTPSYANVTEIQFDEVDGFIISQPGAGQVRIDMPAGAFTGGGTSDTLASWTTPTNLTGDARLYWNGTTGRLSFNDPFVTPTVQFTIGMKDSANDLIQVKVPTVNTNSYGFEYRCHRGAKTAEAAVVNGDVLVQPLLVSGYTGAAFAQACSIDVTARGVSGSVVSSDIQFKTADNVGVLTERFAILNAGALRASSLAGVGTRTVQVDGNGVFSASAITLNGLSASAQTFVNDTNVTMVSAGSTHTITWAGLLATARYVTGSVTSGGVPYFSSTTTLASSLALTNRAMVLGGGSGAAPRTAAAALSNGQLYIGSTGSDPVAASLTAGSGISITPGAGSITITNTGGIASSVTTSTFAALPAASGAFGPIRMLTDNVRGFAIDTHNTSPAVDQWVPLNRPCNARLFGAKSDGSTNDDVAIRAAITAGCKKVFLPSNTIWKVAGNAMPAGEYTIIGEDSSVVIGCAAYPGSCSGSNITWAEGQAIENVTVYEQFGDGTTAGAAKYVPFSMNRAGDGSTNFHLAGQWDRAFSMFFGAANTGSPAGSDVQGLVVTNSSGGDNIVSDCGSNKVISGTELYGCRPFASNIFNSDVSKTFHGSQGVIVTLQTNVSGYAVFAADDFSGKNDNIMWRSQMNAGSTSTVIKHSLGGVEKFKVASDGVITIQGSAGLSVTKTVRDAAGTGTCTLIFTGGILTGGTC